MLLQFCPVDLTMSRDEGFPGARASRPHQAWHSLGHLPHLHQPGTASWLSPPQGAQQRPSWKSFLPFPTFGGSLSSPLQPLSGSSPFFVALRGYLFALVSFFVALHGPLSSLFQPLGVSSRTPFPTFGGSLSSLLQRLSGPSPFFVALRGNLFAFSWKSFLPLATFGGSLSSLLQPLRGPSPSFVALRGYLFAFSWKSIPPWRPLANPSRASSNPFVALRRSSWPFVDIFLPFPGNPFSPSRPLANPSRASSNPFVALRRS